MVRVVAELAPLIGIDPFPQDLRPITVEDVLPIGACVRCIRSLDDHDMSDPCQEDVYCWRGESQSNDGQACQTMVRFCPACGVQEHVSDQQCQYVLDAEPRR